MEQHDPQAIDEACGVMQRQMEQLVALVDDLLDVARISRGKFELRKGRVALGDVVRSAVEAAQPALAARAHELRVTLTPEPLHLSADPYRLAQVIANLLDNAAKYTPDGGLIWLTAEPQGDAVTLSVNDSGVGIAADRLEQVFKMFARSEQSAGDASAGLGIGLALVKTIVELHGGEVEARSDGPGCGAEFRVRLPLATETPPDPPAPLPSIAAVDSPTPQRRVLIVDDNVAAATLLSLVIKKIGNDVRIAHDGLEAVEVASRFRPDVVLMDLGMPRLDGYGAAERIRQEPWGQEMLLVALTGWGQDGHKERTRAAGFDHHLVKPADPSVIRQVLSESRAQRGAAAAIAPTQ
jgi:CheY-like chemotaxis protein